VAWFKDEEWADEAIPLHYQVQLAHQCVVSGNSWGSAAAIIGGNKFVWRDFHVSESFASALVDKCREFWQRVQDGDPPPVDSHPATTLALKKLHPNDNGETVAIGAEACGWDEIILNADRAIASWTEKRDEARNYLRAAIGAATYATLPDGVTYSLKTSTVKGFEVKPRTQRVLRRKDAK
jgi:predicted phage-related endonuclease